MANADTVKFEVNIPQVVALAFAEGRPVESAFTGEQIMFSLVDGRRMYLPPFVAQKIKSAGIGPRAPFQICKKQVGRSMQYEITTHNDEAAGAENAGRCDQSKNGAQQQLQPVLDPNTNTFQFPASVPKHTPAQVAVIERKLSADVAAAAPSAPSMVNRILASYVVAFDVVAQLQRAVEERGLPLNFLQEEHVRAIAATAFIEANKAARP